MPILLSSPNNHHNLFSILNSNSNCTSINSFICVQFWELEAINIPCPFIFTGEYVLQFNAICHSEQQTDECNQYIQEQLQGSILSLSTNLIFDDHICDDVIWSITYDANIIFYDHHTFTTPIISNHVYVVGEDRVYTEILINDINIDSNGYSLLDTKLLNVWLCTIDEQQYGSLTMDENDISHTGCFSSIIDDDGPYHIIVNIDQLFTQNAQHEIDNDNNMIRFSFLVPKTISRDTLYIEVQIELQFTSTTGSRRRLWSDDDGYVNKTNQITHFMGTIAIHKQNTYDIDTNDDSMKNKNENSQIIIILVIVISILALVLILVVVFIKIKCKQNNDYQHHQIQQQGELTQIEKHFPRIM
eukprot:550459_1